MRGGRKEGSPRAEPLSPSYLSGGETEAQRTEGSKLIVQGLCGASGRSVQGAELSGLMLLAWVSCCVLERRWQRNRASGQMGDSLSTWKSGSWAK